MFELLVGLALVGSLVMGRIELFLIFGLFYLCCRGADKYE